MQRSGWRCQRGHLLVGNVAKEGSFRQGFWYGLGFCFLLIVVLGYLQPHVQPYFTHEVIRRVDILVLFGLLIIGWHDFSTARKWQRTGGPVAWAAPRRRGRGAGIFAFLAFVLAAGVMMTLASRHML